MIQKEIITFDELDSKIESLATDDQFRICGELLVAALNDWPTLNLTEPKDLLAELKIEIEKPLSFFNLKNYADALVVGLGDNSWKIESTASLLKMFDCHLNEVPDKDVTLDSIVEELTNHYRLLK
jgi:hypothetical protein